MIKITEFQNEDVNLILKWITTQEDLISWSGKQFSFPLQQMELVNYFKTYEDKPDTFKAFNIELEGERIGHCELTNINTIEKNAAFISKIFLRKELRRNGYATLAISALLSFAFGFLDRVILGVIEDNEAAINCYKKIGFNLVKGKVTSFDVAGKQYSAVWMDLRKEEWKEKLVVTSYEKTKV